MNAGMNVWLRQVICETVIRGVADASKSLISLVAVSGCLRSLPVRQTMYTARQNTAAGCVSAIAEILRHLWEQFYSVAMPSLVDVKEQNGTVTLTEHMEHQIHRYTADGKP